MNNLKAGFARVNVTPMMGIPINGYFIDRLADGVLDELEINALALEAGGKRVILLSIDSCSISTYIQDEFRAHISAVTGLPVEAIYIHATHSHTTPYADPKHGRLPAGTAEIVEEYRQFLLRRFADAAKMAIDDLKPAQMGIGVGCAPNVAFVRRFRMKDGSIKTNPGVHNPDIVAPVGEVDERVNVLRFDREGADSIALLNVGNHPDTVGGCKISADWPGFARRSLEKAINGVKCIFFNGAQGDVNHVNVHPTKGDFNDMSVDFDDVSRGYGHARHMGRVVAAAAMQVWDKVCYTDVDSIKCINRTVGVPSNMPDPQDMPLAHEYASLHNAGRDSDIPYSGMMLTTVVAEALRMVRLEHGPESFPMTFSAISLGNVAFFGIPGEPFNGIGRSVKESEGWDMVLPTCLTNGSEGYFPMKDAYDEGGYEARSSNFKSGVAELIIEIGKEMLGELKS
ncbi:MAG: hypothetical protein IJY39_08645 [Clostridia bacterium]|nr:hypothetical protein [Clostridia bacterium]